MDWLSHKRWCRARLLRWWLYLLPPRRLTTNVSIQCLQSRRYFPTNISLNMTISPMAAQAALTLLLFLHSHTLTQCRPANIATPWYVPSRRYFPTRIGNFIDSVLKCLTKPAQLAQLSFRMPCRPGVCTRAGHCYVAAHRLLRLLKLPSKWFH